MIIQGHEYKKVEKQKFIVHTRMRVL